MWTPKLPKSLWVTYSDYKLLDKKLLRWLLSRAEELGISSAELHSDPVEDAKKSPKKGRGKKKQNTKYPDLELPTELGVNQLVKLTVKM